MQAAERGSPKEAFKVTSRLVSIKPIEVCTKLNVVLPLTTTILPPKWSLVYCPRPLGNTPVTSLEVSTAEWITSCVIVEELNTLLFLLRCERLIEAPIIPRVPPEATSVHITTMFVKNKKRNGAPVGLPSEPTKHFTGLLPLPVTKLAQVEKFVKGILTKPIKLPFVKVTVKVKAFNTIIIPNIPTPY